MLLHTLALLLALPLFDSTARLLAADPCGADVRLDKPGPWGYVPPGAPGTAAKDRLGSMQNVPVLDQGNSSLCYGHSAAQIVDAYRFSHGDTKTNHHTSPIDAIAGTRADSDVSRQGYWGQLMSKIMAKDSYSGGLACEVAWSLSHRGSCDKDKVLSAAFKRDRGGSIRETSEYRAFMDAITEYFEDYSQIHASITARNEGAYDSRNTLYCYLENKNFPTEQLNASLIPTAAALDAMIARHDSKSAAREFFENACGQRQPIDKNMSCVQTISPLMLAPQGRRALIEKHFNGVAPIQPLEMGFCSAILDRDVAPAYAPGPAPFLDPKKCAFHSALLIGRSRDPETGACRYLLRNSWGRDWCNGNLDNKLPGVTCDCKPTFTDAQLAKGERGEACCARYDEEGKCVGSRTSSRCCDALTGNAWIDAELMSKALTGMASLRSAGDAK